MKHIKTKADLNALYGIMNVKQDEKIEEYKLSVWNTLVFFVLTAFRWIRGIIYQPIPRSLTTLTIGALNRVTECERPSEVVDIILDDLHIKKQPSIETYCYLFFQWDTEIKQIEKLFQNTTINDSSGVGIHNKISKQLNINPFAVLIDQMARRFSITMDQASELKWVDVYYALMIDKQNYLIEREYNKMQEAELKKQHRK